MLLPPSQALGQIELLLGVPPQIPYLHYCSQAHPTAVRLAAVQSIIRHYLAEDPPPAAPPASTASAMPAITADAHQDIVDSTITQPAPGAAAAAAAASSADSHSGSSSSSSAADGEFTGNCAGFAKALAFALHLATTDSDRAVSEGAVTLLLDALERKPCRAAHLARFQSADPLLGACDPWCSGVFQQNQTSSSNGSSSGNGCPLGSVYRPHSPLPRIFPGDVRAAAALWSIMSNSSSSNNSSSSSNSNSTAYSQPARCSALRLYRCIWGWGSPPSLGLPLKPNGWAGSLELSVAAWVKQWVKFRPARRDAASRDAFRHHYAVLNGASTEALPSAPRQFEEYGPDVAPEQAYMGLVAPPPTTVTLKFRQR
jgi:hypothetical protein